MAQTKNMTTKINPVKHTGTLEIGGKKVAIGQNSVKSEPGSSPKILLKRLRDISRKSIFSPPVFSLND